MNSLPKNHPSSTPRALPIGLSPALLSELDVVADWGLLATDRNLVITHFNPWLERHVGRSAESFLGKPLLDVFPSLATRKHDHRYHQALEGRSAVLSQRLHKYLLPLPPPTPQSRFEFMQQTCRIIPLVQESEICGTLTILEDVTERVAYETELRERVSALRDADRHKDEFLAMLAHELRNPLAPISNALQIMQIGDKDEVMRGGAREIIKRQVSQLVRLVDDLLDVSRVSCGKIQLQRLRIDLCAVARQAVETSRPLIESRRHHFEQLLPDEPVWVDGDFVRLAQLISNLLNNAAKYTDVEGQISLTVESSVGSLGHQSEAIVRVQDNGRGIDPTARDRLFSLFYQADRNLDRSEGGLGIGLALARSLAEMHGGRIEVDSAGRGLGSEFILRLPLLTSTPPRPIPKEPSTTPVIKPLQVLVVDDNQDSVESMAMLLRADGHAVSTSNDAYEAIEIALKERPSAVLLDIGLPRLTGYEVCATLRQAGLTESCIIAMSGYPPVSGSLDQEEGFDAHLVKPVDYERVKRVISVHMERMRVAALR